ncbi:hypothetical protein OIV83_005528 [Microbotryomycetes sp. JL201]|nr:hypothetical protein OIV83_005528 [Microbotryomycetes sp. JL201]
MSYEGQIHHPHKAGTPPNAHLITAEAADGPVRRRLTGVGDIPPVFQLCAAGRQFSNAVLKHTGSPVAVSGLERSHSYEGAVDEVASFQNEQTDESVIERTAATGQESGTVTRGLLNVRRLTEQQGDGNEAVRGGMSDCYWGELTDLGRESTLTLGSRLRALYVESLKLLPLTLPDVNVDENPVVFRSTPMYRTIESLHQIAVGLFPDGHRDGPVEYTVRNANDESLYPNSLCPRMRVLDAAGVKRAAETYNKSLETIDPLVRKYVKAPLRIDGKPAASSVLDTIYVARAHGIRVPSEFEDPAVLRTLEAAVVHEWFDVYSNFEFRKLAMGRLLGDLKAALVRKAQDPKETREKARLSIYACHDTSVGGILNALDAFDGRWPPFTSHLAVELFRASPSSSTSSPNQATSGSFFSAFVPSFLQSSLKQQQLQKQHYVRLLFNAKPVILPACQATGNHLPGTEGAVCTLEAFSAAVSKVELTGKQWEQGCAVVGA